MTSMASDDPKFTALAGYAAFKEKGGQVYVPTPEEKAQFVESVQPLKQWYVERFGDKWLKLLEASIAEAEKESRRRTCGCSTSGAAHPESSPAAGAFRPRVFFCRMPGRRVR